MHCHLRPPIPSVVLVTRPARESTGVKVSWNVPERRSGAQKFKPRAFRLQNYWVLQPEPTFLSPASEQRYSNPIVNKSFKLHILRSQIHA